LNPWDLLWIIPLSIFLGIIAFVILLASEIRNAKELKEMGL
jgi:hypothetical protein